ncbi:MAG: hypothetical protein HW394_1471 [Acidobacteria bacterium]|nr:hypothetical protein [Acidobacteriota bacterium]
MRVHTIVLFTISASALLLAMPLFAQELAGILG